MEKGFGERKIWKRRGVGRVDDSINFCKLGACFGLRGGKERERACLGAERASYLNCVLRARWAIESFESQLMIF